MFAARMHMRMTESNANQMKKKDRIESEKRKKEGIYKLSRTIERVEINKDNKNAQKTKESSENENKKSDENARRMK
jgi:hypothetical protein